MILNSRTLLYKKLLVIHDKIDYLKMYVILTKIYNLVKSFKFKRNLLRKNLHWKIKCILVLKQVVLKVRVVLILSGLSNGTFLYFTCCLKGLIYHISFLLLGLRLSTKALCLPLAFFLYKKMHLKKNLLKTILVETGDFLNDL